MFCFQNLPKESSSESQNKKKIVDPILGYIRFYFETRAHLGHLLEESLIDDLV